MRGARVARKELLENMELGPEQSRLLVVWINMLEADDWSAAKRATEIFEPFPYVPQFHDPNQRIGMDLASSIQYPEEIAWDFYVFYQPGALWLDYAPRPHDWVHQLGEVEWPDPDKYYWDEDLAPALRTAMEKILGGE